MPPLILSTSRADFSLLRELHYAFIDQSGPLSGTLMLRMSDNAYLLDNDTPYGIAQSTGLAVMKVSDMLHKFRPSLLVILGDRFETLAAATAAHLMGIPIAHLHGGEVSLGSKDDKMRRAITQLATYHFVASETSAFRVSEQLNRSWWDTIEACHGHGRDIFKVGAIGLDLCKSVQDIKVPHPFILVSVPEGEGLPEILDAITSMPFRVDYISLGPNADAGRKTLAAWATHDKLEPRDYLAYLKAADVAVGSSSSFLIEAHALGTVAINVGDRQKGREANPSVINVPVDVDAIRHAIVKALDGEYDAYLEMASPFGLGDAAERTAKICARLVSSPHDAAVLD